MPTNKQIAHERYVAKLMAEDARKQRGKRGRWLHVREAISEARFLQFRPYRVRRDGKHRLGAYDMRHCSRAVREFETIEAFFHAQAMRAAGYRWSLGGMGDGLGGRWWKE